MPFFTGEHETIIAAKRRLAICSALRDDLFPDDGKEFYLTLGPDKKLWLYPDAYYRRLAGTMKRGILPSRQVANMSMFFAMARLLKPDAQGRVVLPEKSLKRAGMDNVENVTLVGKGDHIEIWPSDEWEAVVDVSMDSYSEMLYEAADMLNADSNDN